MTSPSVDRRYGLNASAAIKVPVRVATTANITLNGLQSIDGVTVVADDRVLVKNQTNTVNNGIYLSDTGAWTRDVDFNGARDIVKGTIVTVNEGNTQARSLWRVTTSNPITIGSSALTFVENIASANDSSNFTYLPAGTGAVATTVQTKLRAGFITPEDRGAVGDGVTDDTTALTNWLSTGGNLAGGIGKTYKITAELPAVSNTFIDWRGSSIKCAVRIRSYIYGNSITNFTMINSGQMDMGQDVLATYTATDYSNATYQGSNFNMVCYFNGCSNINIERNKFKNLYTTAMYFYNCTGYVNVLNNAFTSPIQAQKILATHVAMQTCSADFKILNNSFINVAPSSPDFGVNCTVASGTSGMIEIAGNTFDYGGRNTVGTHQLSPVSFYGDSLYANVHHNKFTNCLYGGVRLTSTWNARCHHNTFTTATIGDYFQYVSIESSWFGGTYNGCQNIAVHHNTFTGRSGNLNYGVAVTSSDYAVPSKSVWIHHNQFTDILAVLSVDGAYDGIRFERNQITGAEGNRLRVAINASSTAAHGVTQAQSVCKNLFIEKNVWSATGAAYAAPLLFCDLGTYTGTVGLTRVEGNNITAAAATAQIAVGIRNTQVGSPNVMQGNVIVRDNWVDNYGTAYQVYYAYETTLENNQARGATTFIDTSANIVRRSGNTQKADGASSGRAVLVGGTVTVSTTEVVASDNISLTCVLVGGTQGSLSVGTIVAGTSFVINSSNGADTSTVYWEIRH